MYIININIVTHNIAHKLTNIKLGLVTGNSSFEKSQTKEITQLNKLLKWKMEQAKLLTNNMLQVIPEPWISTETNNKVPNSRIQRGWFDFGGAALGKVFGLATENYFKEVNKKLQRLGMVLSHQGKVARN